MTDQPQPISPELSDRCIAGLPQEKPFLFVDRITGLTPGRVVTAEVSFAADHPVFDGHLPGYPLVPGVIVIEALAQAAGLVLIPEGALEEGGGAPQGDDGSRAKAFGYLAEVRRVRFKRAVLPGEVMRTECRLGRAFGTAASFEVTAWVGDEVAAEGEIVVGGMR